MPVLNENYITWTSQNQKDHRTDDADYTDLRGFLLGFIRVYPRHQRNLRSIKSLPIVQENNFLDTILLVTCHCTWE